METESNLKHLLVDILTSVNCKAHRLTDNTIQAYTTSFLLVMPSIRLFNLVLTSQNYQRDLGFLSFLHVQTYNTHITVYRVADYRANQQISLKRFSALSLSSCSSLGQFAVPHMPILNLFESQSLLIWVPNISSPLDHSF